MSINNFLAENFTNYKLLDITKSCTTLARLSKYVDEAHKKQNCNIIFIIHRTKDNSFFFPYFINGLHSSFLLLNKENYYVSKMEYVTKRAITAFLENEDHCCVCDDTKGGIRCEQCGNILCQPCIRQIANVEKIIKCPVCRKEFKKV